MPYELRYLVDRYTGIRNEQISCKQDENLVYRSKKKPVHRYMIDLSRTSEPVIQKPEKYYDIKIEDRLFIDEHFVPLFEKYGYPIE